MNRALTFRSFRDGAHQRDGPGIQPRIQKLFLDSGFARFRDRPGKTIAQSAKLVPQPQEAFACGFFTLNEAPIRSSTKSISEPAM